MHKLDQRVVHLGSRVPPVFVGDPGDSDPTHPTRLPGGQTDRTCGSAKWLRFVPCHVGVDMAPKCFRMFVRFVRADVVVTYSSDIPAE
jgi:hypothetical protein